MEYKLSKTDTNTIVALKLQTGSQFLRKMLNQKYEIGEVLICKKVRFEDEECEVIQDIVTEKYDHSLTDIRYLVIHKDEDMNNYYLKQYLENGKLSSQIISTLDVREHCSWYGYTWFEVDSNKIDALLLDADFNIESVLKEEKERKDKIAKANKDSAIKIYSVNEINKWLETLPKNGHIYFHPNKESSFYDNHYETVSLSKLRKIKMKDYRASKHYSNFIRNRNQSQIDRVFKTSNFIYMLRSSRENSGKKITSADLLDMAIYTTEPINLKGNL